MPRDLDEPLRPRPEQVDRDTWRGAVQECHFDAEYRGDIEWCRKLEAAYPDVFGEVVTDV